MYGNRNFKKFQIFPGTFNFLIEYLKFLEIYVSVEFSAQGMQISSKCILGRNDSKCMLVKIDSKKNDTNNSETRNNAVDFTSTNNKSDTSIFMFEKLFTEKLF